MSNIPLHKDKNGALRLTYYLAQLYERGLHGAYEEWLSKQTDDIREVAEHNKRKSIIDVEDILTRDQMTGIRNRAYFYTKLNDVVRRTAADDSEFTLLYVDLSKFKELNDTYGHAAGDQAIIKTAALLRNLTEEHGFAARLGGDELIAILEGPSGETRAKEFLDQNRSFTFLYKGDEVPVNLSAGTIVVDQAFITRHHHNVDEIVHEAVEVAEHGMYADKREQGHKIRSRPRSIVPEHKPSVGL